MLSLVPWLQLVECVHFAAPAYFFWLPRGCNTTTTSSSSSTTTTNSNNNNDMLFLVTWLQLVRCVTSGGGATTTTTWRLRKTVAWQQWRTGYALEDPDMFIVFLRCAVAVSLGFAKKVYVVFTACQVRAVRLDQGPSPPPPLVLPLPLLPQLWALPGFNGKLRWTYCKLAIGRQLQAHDRCGACRASTASSRSLWALPRVKGTTQWRDWSSQRQTQWQCFPSCDACWG